MSLDDTQSSAEILIDSVIRRAHHEFDDEQSPSTDYESIHSSPELHKLVLLVQICRYEEEPIDPEFFTQDNIRELCNSTKGHYDPFNVEIMSEYKARLNL